MLHFEDAKETYSYQFDCGMNVVIPLMKRTQMGDEEYVLIKNIVLFSSDLDYKENSVEIIRKAFKKYANILLEHLKSRYNDENQVIATFNDLMMIPRCMQSLGEKMNRHYSSLVLTNCGNVRGSLSEEIFWRL
ncbi:unnamed protein product, partial [Mesorhabditis belari]|uniref:NR LBD domain-containing protein n=1 Tax=Mesorhabditis belari TaxID=2138241 RepID=A0AAF3ES87_9BILA